MTHATVQHCSDALRWAIESEANPALAASDWLARDIDPAQPSAVALLTNPDAPLRHLQQAKNVYKTMRILGETAADRRVGGRLYLAAIAAAIVVHGRRITRQSDAALDRALLKMVEDAEAPQPLRALAGTALATIRRGAPHDDHSQS